MVEALRAGAATKAGSALSCGEFDRTSSTEHLPQFLTVEEIACYLGIGRTLAYTLVRSGALPVVRLGRLIRISRNDLAQMQQLSAA